MEIPQDALVVELVAQLTEGEREDFEERAAIMEFDGKLDRGHAEALALLDLLRRHPALAVRLFVKANPSINTNRKGDRQ